MIVALYLVGLGVSCFIILKKLISKFNVAEQVMGEKGVLKTTLIQDVDEVNTYMFAGDGDLFADIEIELIPSGNLIKLRPLQIEQIGNYKPELTTYRIKNCMKIATTKLEQGDSIFIDKTPRNTFIITNSVHAQRKLLRNQYGANYIHLAGSTVAFAFFVFKLFV